jgi:hypothetical protein
VIDTEKQFLQQIFFRPEKTGNNEEQLASAEGAFTYHTVVALGLWIVQ